MNQIQNTKSNYSNLTGIPGMDTQHNDLLSMCDSLLDILEKSDISSDFAVKSVREIIETLKSHFSAEENLLTLTNFPQRAEHTAQHKEQFELLLNELDALLERKNPEISCFVNHLRDVVLTQINVFDRDYAVHINNLMGMRDKLSFSAAGIRG